MRPQAEARNSGRHALMRKAAPDDAQDKDDVKQDVERDMEQNQHQTQGVPRSAKSQTCAIANSVGTRSAVSQCSGEGIIAGCALVGGSPIEIADDLRSLGETNSKHLGLPFYSTHVSRDGRHTAPPRRPDPTIAKLPPDIHIDLICT